MGAGVKITWEGIDTVINNLDAIEQKAEDNLVKQTKALSDDGKAVWKEGTPEGKTKRLRGEETSEPSGLSVTYSSPTYYYKFVDEGHKTARGWRRHRRDGTVYYQKAKHQSEVKGREMTKKLIDWLQQNTREYLSKFLDGV